MIIFLGYGLEGCPRPNSTQDEIDKWHNLIDKESIDFIDFLDKLDKNHEGFKLYKKAFEESHPHGWSHCSWAPRDAAKSFINEMEKQTGSKVSDLTKEVVFLCITYWLNNRETLNQYLIEE